ncbi:hypothetical protein F442_20101 [Phytophthora nicotianae P10297]|uniref:SWIM-type domain-containing protein n=1 Tax=Phytophthora nicotianae P10297 TaxID=1317064 RepID=W2Y8R0_PHYNI|nr:hypothetical protein F442_20101 [Phytophthora nicotianae P10297]
MKSAGADAKGILDYLRRNTGRVMVTDVFGEVGELADVTIEKKQAVKASCHLMMKSRNALEYKKYKDTMLGLLGGNTSDQFYKYFQANWELCKDEIECGWGKLKQKVKREYTIDEMLATIIMLQEWSEDSYVKEFTALDTRQTPLQEDAVDPELSTLAVQLSPHAYRIVAKQYRFAISDPAQYCIDASTPGKALLHMEGVEDGERHVVNTQTFQGGCVFMQTLLLPCRHVMRLRLVVRCESVIPPPKYYTRRWSLLAPSNDITAGSIDCAGSFQMKTLPDQPRAMMTNDQKFSNARALCERIQGIMASQTRSAFEATFNILSNVEVMIRQGRGEELADIVKQMSVSSAKKVECASKERKREFIFSSAPANLQVERRKAGKAKQSQALTKVRQRALLYEDSKKLKPPQLTEIGILLRQSTLLFRFCWQDGTT